MPEVGQVDYGGSVRDPQLRCDGVGINLVLLLQQSHNGHEHGVVAGAPLIRFREAIMTRRSPLSAPRRYVADRSPYGKDLAPGQRRSADRSRLMREGRLTKRRFALALSLVHDTCGTEGGWSVADRCRQHVDVTRAPPRAGLGRPANGRDHVSGWEDGAVATFVAALIAGVVGLAAIVVTVIDGISTRRVTKNFTAREQSWTRWSWTIEKTLSDTPAEREMGLAMMDALSDMPWLTEDDERIALAVAQAVIARNERKEP